jgi:hypothetical protein
MALSESKEPLISEMIAVNSKGKLFKVSGALKDSLENRLRRAGYSSWYRSTTRRKEKAYKENFIFNYANGSKIIKRLARLCFRLMIDLHLI